MKPRRSSLNPYAAPYVPFTQRETNAGTSADGTVWFQSPKQVTQDQQLGTKSLLGAEALPVKIQPAPSSYTSSQNERDFTDNQITDIELDMNMEFLRMTFPGISDQSLEDVYNVNNGDVDATIDMLSQLEFDNVDSSGILPETLDIGDVSDSVFPADSASLKPEGLAAKGSTSSSHLGSANIL
uniref:CUE domain-containing protein n=1 Tax=Lotus japonicus TaxID=34305 RepID=I3SNT6_LOTJA|nr:unknown [Lotus japonicus]